jgi:hypothetical protein
LLFLEIPPGFRRVGRFDDIKAKVSERIRRERANSIVIFYDENGFRMSQNWFFTSSEAMSSRA